MTATPRMDRARQHARTLRQAIANVESADARLGQAMDRRAEVIAGQDGQVAAAEQQRAVAIAAVAEAVGVDVASGLLDVAKAEVRRALASHSEVA